MTTIWNKVKAWFCKERKKPQYPKDIKRHNSEPFVNRKLYAGHTPHPKRIREEPALEAVLNARRHSM